MKKKYLFILLCAISQGLQAQTDSLSRLLPKWEHKLQTGINLNQSSFSDNWKGGGVSSYAYAWFFNYLAKKHSEKWDVNSDLQMQLGFLQNQGKSEHKSMDRIFYDFKIGRKLSDKWNLFVSLNFLTQFKEGFDYNVKSRLEPTNDSLISNFLAPGYLTSSFGLEYKPVNYLWMRFGMGTLRQTFVTDKRISDAQLYGLVHKGDHLRNQAVLQYILSFDKELVKNVNFRWRYMLNFDYFNAGKPNAFVHIFNANLTLKATKYLSTNLSVNIIRDYDQDKDIQLSQSLSLGIIYSLSR